MAITYSIDGGADAAKFNINSTTGALTFKTAPDFEAPGDANADNVYEVSVKATDAGGAASSKLIKVTVTDVSENAPPQITSAGAVSVKENATTVMTVTATDPDDGGTTPPPTGDDTDGSANAPTGTPQLATLLDGLASKPPWKVAGVHYRVGIKTGVTLKAPAAMTGVTVSNRVCTITGDNVTMDGYDFGSGGPWHVQVNGSNARFLNCKFVGGKSQGPSGGSFVYVNTHPAAGGAGCYFGYCEFDGAGKDGFIINYTAEGQQVMEYCWIHDGATDLVAMSSYYNSGRMSKYTARFNVWQNAGLLGGHPDWIQIYGGAITSLDFHHNLGTQNKAFGTQGWIFDDTDAGDFAANTMLCRNGGNVSYYVSATPGTAMKGFNNYVDATGCYGFVYPGAGGTYTNNVNMVNGGPMAAETKADAAPEKSAEGNDREKEGRRRLKK